MKTDTIAAIATALSNSGLSIIRISGEDAFTIIDKIYTSKSGNKKLSNQESHTIHYGFIKDGEIIIDEVMVVVMHAPRTYTCENVIEINCHGGVLVTNKILETVIKHGARIAEPGEFTKRAFLNGRIDLSKAEAVIDVIHAKNEYALASSVKHLKGEMSDAVIKIRDIIIYDIAYIEAALDDPEHIDINDYMSTLEKNICESIKKIQKLLDTADNGRIITEGIQTVILGKPNAGKSSLLNRLVKQERAIVTDIAGTTRDALHESININGLQLNIVDTAGIRDTENIVEQIGVQKAVEYASEADLILYVIDGSTNLDENDLKIIDTIKEKKFIVLINKSDLDMKVSIDMIKELTNSDPIVISAKTTEGLDRLEANLLDMFIAGKVSFNDEVYVTNMRHKAALIESLESLKQVKDSIDAGMPEDFLSIDLMNAYAKLGEIVGEEVDEDLVNTIFKKFCMGK